jgi:nucleotide-binding universal stress UspA family protein
MVDFKRILVPVDFSDPSKKAVHRALSLALQFDATLVLAHIVPPSVGLVTTYPTESLAFEKEQARYAKATLPALVPEEFRETVNLQTIVKVGIVKDEILAIVGDEKIDLVVMGTHGRNGFERFFLGSLTERMLRRIPVPILTVSHLDAATEPQSLAPVPLRNVLYATDLSDSAEVGLRVAMELARGAGAHLTVLHVLKAVETIYFGAEGGYLKEDLDDIREDTFKRLMLSIPEQWSKGVNVTPLMSEGDPFREILRVADEEKTDLIVMNLQGRGFVERALLGSTAERVIRSAHVPVLSIPAPVEYAARLRKTSETAA